MLSWNYSRSTFEYLPNWGSKLSHLYVTLQKIRNYHIPTPKAHSFRLKYRGTYSHAYPGQITRARLTAPFYVQRLFLLAQYAMLIPINHSQVSILTVGIFKTHHWYQGLRMLIQMLLQKLISYTWQLQVKSYQASHVRDGYVLPLPTKKISKGSTPYCIGDLGPCFFSLLLSYCR